MGIFLLEMCCLQSIDCIYDAENLTINTQQMLVFLRKIEVSYKKILCDFIYNLLILNEDLRLGLQDIIKDF
jgi:uncharacterized protein YaaW (UPF0174 family)